MLMQRSKRCRKSSSPQSNRKSSHERVTRSRDDGLMNHRLYILPSSAIPRRVDGCCATYIPISKGARWRAFLVSTKSELYWRGQLRGLLLTYRVSWIIGRFWPILVRELARVVWYRLSHFSVPLEIRTYSCRSAATLGEPRLIYPRVNAHETLSFSPPLPPYVTPR